MSDSEGHLYAFAPGGDASMPARVPVGADVPQLSSRLRRNVDGTYDGVDLDDLIARIERAMRTLRTGADDGCDENGLWLGVSADRLRQKADGLLIAYGYVDELRRVAG